MVYNNYEFIGNTALDDGIDRSEEFKADIIGIDINDKNKTIIKTFKYIMYITILVSVYMYVESIFENSLDILRDFIVYNVAML